MKNGPMKKVMISALLLCLATASLAASAAQPAAAPASCDRECLRSHVTQVLWALVNHDVSKLPVADNVRVTEDADEKKLKDVSLIRSVTALQNGLRSDQSAAR